MTGLLVGAAFACDRAPSPAGLKEWAPADHDGEKRSAPAANQGAKGDGGGTQMLVDITWQNQCQSCHGPSGHGDGAQGPMLKATNLSQEDWQSKTSDEDIVRAITQGKGKMPQFDLSEDVVKGLVARVRSFRGK